MTCIEAAETVRLWEENPNGVNSAEPNGSFLSHLESCSACRKRYGALAFFIRREQAPRAEEQKPGFEDSVMRIVRAAAHTAEQKRARLLPFGYPQLAAAALLLVVFAAGFLYRGALSGETGDTVPVHFTFNAPDAESVVLVGSFPGWSAEDGHPMTRNGRGQWELTVRLKKSGVYTYNFLVDGTEWVPDPSAAEAVDDGFGGLNSLIRL